MGIRGAGWAEVKVVTSAEAAEAAGALLRDLPTNGLVEERPAANVACFRCYLRPSHRLPATLRRLRTRVRNLLHHGLDPGPARVTSRVVAPHRWARALRAWARPVRVGPLLIRPTWIRGRVPAGTTVIRIDPGMAFGTGTHASTRLCLSALTRYLPPRRADFAPTVFDIGTGSGILAITAARLGAARVWAVDTDPIAVTAARANVRLNGVASRVRVARRSGLSGAPGRADLILANLVAETIIPLLPHVRKHLTRRGVFIGSGILADRAPAIRRAAHAAGLRLGRMLSEGEWRAVVLSRYLKRK